MYLLYSTIICDLSICFLTLLSQPNKRSAELSLQRRGSKSSGMLATASISGGGEMDGLREQLASLNSSSGKPPRHAGTEGGGNASLLKRAKVAEEQVEALRKQLEAAERNASRASGSGGKTAGGAGTGGGGADPAEIKKLQRRIKELESQGGGGGGGGNAAGDKKALAAAEKKFEKQTKETEKANRKEKAALESRVSGLEKELEDTSGQLREAATERDQLRQRVKELGNANAEMEKLREKVGVNWNELLCELLVFVALRCVAYSQCVCVCVCV